jgi:uncharacterized protein YhaN
MDSLCSDSSPWSDPLNATIYADSMHDDSHGEPESDFNFNTIINNINVNTFNNINNIQVNSIQEINYVIGINNINNITHFTNTNNYHTVNNINTSTNVTTNNFSLESVLSTPNTSDSNISSGSPRKAKDEVSAEKEKKARLFNRTTTHHKRRGSDTESSPKLDEKYQRRHSEGKVLRIAGLREQVSIHSMPTFFYFIFYIYFGTCFRMTFQGTTSGHTNAEH